MSEARLAILVFYIIVAFIIYTFAKEEFKD